MALQYLRPTNQTTQLLEVGLLISPFPDLANLFIYITSSIETHRTNKKLMEISTSWRLKFLGFVSMRRFCKHVILKKWLIEIVGFLYQQYVFSPWQDFAWNGYSDYCYLMSITKQNYLSRVQIYFQESVSRDVVQIVCYTTNTTRKTANLYISELQTHQTETLPLGHDISASHTYYR